MRLIFRIWIGLALLAPAALAGGVDGSNAAFSYLPTANTYHVSTAGVDSGSCGSTAQPCRTIQYAVNRAQSGDTILVAKGTYSYNASNDLCTFLVTRAVVCFVDKHLAILGGYTDGNWSAPNPSANPTLIDGGGSWRGVAIIAYNATASLNMQGFTIQNGRAQGRTSGDTYFRHAWGGGMWAQNSTVNLKHVVFRNNTAVGGSNSSLAAGGWGLGGGLALEGSARGATSYLEAVTFEANQALGGDGSVSGGITIGGGMIASQARVVGSQLVFTDNIARSGNAPGNGVNPATGVTADALGGAAGFETSSSTILTSITASGNQAIGGNAGAASNARAGAGLGGAIHTEDSTFTLTQADVLDNQAIGGVAARGGIGMGGGLFTDKSQVTLERVKLVANLARSGSSSTGGSVGQVGGGGAYFASFITSGDYRAKLTNGLVAGNRIELGAAGIPASGGGGGIVIQGVTVDIIHTTIADNLMSIGLAVGQAMVVQGTSGSTGKPGVLNLRYSLITDHINPSTENTSALTTHIGSTANLSYVWFGNNTNPTNENGKPSPPGAYLLNHVWKESGSARYILPGSPAYDYHLLSVSPVIDLGAGSTTTIDLDGLSRPVGAVPDLGAYEFRTPILRADPSSSHVMTDLSSIITRSSYISVTSGPIAEWTAATEASWIYLGASGALHQTSGLTGTNLTIRIDPSKVGLGKFEATISLTSPSADPTVLTVHLIKALDVKELFFPALFR